MNQFLHNYVLPLVLAAGLLGPPAAYGQGPDDSGGGAAAGFGAQMSPPAEAPSMGQPSADMGVPDQAPARELELPSDQGQSQGQGQSQEPQFEPQQVQRQQLTPDDILGQKPGSDLDFGQPKGTDAAKPKSETKPGDFESQAGKLGQTDVTKPKKDVDPLEGPKSQIPDKIKVPDQAKDPDKAPDKAPDQAKAPDKGTDPGKTPDKDQGKGKDPWDDKDQAKGKDKDKHDDHWDKGKKGKGGVVIRYHPTAVITYVQGRPVCGWKKVTECTEKKVWRKGKKVTIETCVDRKKPIFCY